MYSSRNAREFSKNGKSSSTVMTSLRSAVRSRCSPPERPLKPQGFSGFSYMLKKMKTDPQIFTFVPFAGERQASASENREAVTIEPGQNGMKNTKNVTIYRQERLTFWSLPIIISLLTYLINSFQWRQGKRQVSFSQGSLRKTNICAAALAAQL